MIIGCKGSYIFRYAQQSHLGIFALDKGRWTMKKRDFTIFRYW